MQMVRIFVLDTTWTWLRTCQNLIVKNLFALTDGCPNRWRPFRAGGDTDDTKNDIWQEFNVLPHTCAGGSQHCEHA